MLAKALKDGLRLLFPGLSLFLSEEDVPAGTRWDRELAERLADSNIGILCVTPESATNPWLLFEAGALSKSLHHAHLIPCCLGIGRAELPGPMGQFQSLEADRPGIDRLVTTLCDLLGLDVSLSDRDRALVVIMRAIEEIPRVVPPSLPHVSDLLAFGEHGETRYRGSHERIRRTSRGELVQFLAVTGYGLFRMPGAGQTAGYVEALQRGTRFQGVVMDPASAQAQERMAVETPAAGPDDSLLASDAIRLRTWLRDPDPNIWPRLARDQLRNLDVRYTHSALTFGMILFNDIAFIEPLHLGRVGNQPHLCGFSVIRAPAGSRDYQTASSYFAYLYDHGSPVTQSPNEGKGLGALSSLRTP